MRKADLLGLPIAEPRPPQANGKPVNYVTCFRLHELNGEKVLVMDAFDATCKTLMRRSFFWEGDFTTRSYDPDQKAWKWRTAMLPAVLDVFWFTDGNGSPIPDAESAEAVRAFLPDADFDDDHLYNAVVRYQEKINADKLYARHQRALEPTKRKMAAVPALPEGVDKWIDDDLLFRSRYLLYRYTGKKKQAAYCSRCGAHVEAEGLRHLQFTTCPACGTQAQALAEGRVSKYGFTDHISFCVIQRYSDTEIVARHFNVGRNYEHDTALHRLTCKDEWDESVRSFWSRKGKKIQSEDYQMGVYKGNTRNGWDWMPYKDAPYPPHRIYPNGLTDELHGTFAQYSGLDAFARGRYLVKIDGYFDYWAAHPEMEYLAKGGLYRLAAEISEMQRSYYDKPKINTSALKRHVRDLRSLNGGYYALLAFEHLDKCHLRYDAAEVIRYMDDHTDYRNLGILMQYASLKRINDYLRKYKCRDVQELMDYWSMQKNMGANMTENRVLFPDNLRKAHNEAVKEYNKRRDEWMLKGFAIAAREVAKRFSFAAGGLMIVVPESSGDLEAEGKALSHCVRTYAERMANGETTIVFVRKADDPGTPFYTMEIKAGKVMQLRGKHNCAPTPAVAKFEKEFCKECHLLPRSA